MQLRLIVKNTTTTKIGDIMEKGRVIANTGDKEYSNSNTENSLLNRLSSEEKARKRTRGPYRKSSS